MWVSSDDESFKKDKGWLVMSQKHSRSFNVVIDGTFLLSAQR
jgi:hypothetical protein